MTEPDNLNPPDTALAPLPFLSTDATTFTVTFTGPSERNTMRLQGEGSLIFDGGDVIVEAGQHPAGAAPRRVRFMFALAEVARVGLHDGALVLVVKPAAQPDANYILSFYVASEEDAHRVMTILHPPAAAGMPDGHPESWRFFESLRATPTFATKALLAANIAVFALMALGGVSLMDPDPVELVHWGARLNPLIDQGQWWRMLTPMFVHVGLIHLAVNMWALRALGDFIERLFGPWRYLAIYFGAGLLGDVLSYYFKPAGIAAGASGAIFGILGALVAFIFRRHRVIPRQVLVGLRSNAFSIISLNLVFGFMVPAVDNSAHLGGLCGGFVLGWLLARPLPGPEEEAPRRSGRIPQIVLIAGLALLFSALILLGRLATPISAVRGPYYAQEAVDEVTAMVKERDGAQASPCQAITELREIAPNHYRGQARQADGRTFPVEIRQQGDEVTISIP